MQLTNHQQQEVLRIVSKIPWGDVESALKVIDDGLAIAMRATREDFIRWEHHHDDAGFIDEFSIADISALATEWRYALTARVIRSIAMAYGVGTDYSTDEIGEVDCADTSAAGTVVRKLLQAVTPVDDL